MSKPSRYRMVATDRLSGREVLLVMGWSELDCKLSLPDALKLQELNTPDKQLSVNALTDVWLQWWRPGDAYDPVGEWCNIELINGVRFRELVRGA